MLVKVNKELEKHWFTGKLLPAGGTEGEMSGPA